MTRFPRLAELLTGPVAPRPDIAPILANKRAQVARGGPGSDLAASFLAGVSTVLLTLEGKR